MSGKIIASAEKRRFSPDMKVRWMPTLNGKVVAPSGSVPFSGYARRAEAIAAARNISRTST